nr:Protein short hypocotyl in white light 1 [Ipomoea batatas]
MAGVAAIAAAATSTLILTSPPSASPHSSLALPPSPFPGLRSSTLPRFHRTNPSLTICHAKVSFAVDGVLILASLSILKAFLEVICTLGGTVFVVILLLRVLWSAVDYFQSSSTGFNQSGASYGNSQPVT